MADKLSQSLDQILSENRKGGVRKPRSARPQRRAGTKATAAPVGGVKKTVRGEKKVIPTGPSGGAARDSKIIVSNLPFDVDEAQIKEYFGQAVGTVKRVDVSYGLNGQSKGIATIIFGNPTFAAKAAKEFDGIRVDGKPMKIEVVLRGADAPAPPAPKSLSDRVSKPKAAVKTKAQPKPATAAKSATSTKGEKKKPRPRRAARPKAKTADELDAEMQDYFGGDNTANGSGDAAMANGGAVQPTNGDASMDEDVIA